MKTTSKIRGAYRISTNIGTISRRTAFAQLLDSGPELVLFDTLSEAHLAPVGELVWEAAVDSGPLFSVGSSGLEYALVAHWRDQGWLPPVKEDFAGRPVDQLVAVSGSCSPVTQRQIDCAVAHGFVDIELAAVDLVDQNRAPAAIEAAIEAAIGVLARGQSPLLHTARGGQDRRIGQTAAHLRRLGYGDLDIKLRSGALFGRALGRILLGVLRQKPLARAVVAGGDTSAYAARQLGIEALEVVGPMAPGSPLCRIHTADPALDGLEITFKGGQVGGDDFFLAALRGRP